MKLHTVHLWTGNQGSTEIILHYLSMPFFTTLLQLKLVFLAFSLLSRKEGEKRIATYRRDVLNRICSYNQLIAINTEQYENIKSKHAHDEYVTNGRPGKLLHTFITLYFFYFILLLLYTWLFCRVSASIGSGSGPSEVTRWLGLDGALTANLIDENSSKSGARVVNLPKEMPGIFLPIFKP